MTIKILVPELGESVLEATIGEWRKQEGDFVELGEPLVELETDKVNVEVGAERSGILTRIEHQAGEDVHVGDVLGELDETAERKEGDNGKVSASKKTNAGQSKATQPQKVIEPKQSEPATEPAAGLTAETKATPIAQKMAREMNLDLNRVTGTGPGGRITKENIEEYVDQQRTAGGHQQAGGSQTPIAEPSKPAPKSELRKAEPAVSTPLEVVDGRREERVKMSRRRRTIAQRLVEAQHTAAMLTTFNEIDMSAVMDLRKRRNEAFLARYGIKLGLTSFFVKASIGALKAFPLLNAEIQGDEMVIKRYYDIGIAVGAAEGLVVPVLRDAERMSFAQIEKKIKEFAAQAEDGTLSLEDLRGGTFSITNGGVFGSLLSTPILNLPQVGILGLHKIEPRPVAVGSEIVIRPMMYVAVSYDHRIVDGREAVQFLVRIKELVEDPETLLIEG